MKDENKKEILEIFQKEVRRISNKIDFNELDEIQNKLVQVERSTRPFRFFNSFLICILSLTVGYVMSVFIPIKILDKEKLILDNFKAKGVKISENNEYKYIVFPSGMERQTKNGQTAYLIKK
uniref:hypothetical protein n=1 Tax=Aliarcobacter sp. TaxID=2321116 RepID=UPI00404772DB